MCENKFYICEKCGNIVGLIERGGGQLVCCGQKMKALVVGAIDASREKHVPEVTIDEGKVKVTVGSVTHPMTKEHHISWVYLETDRGGQRKCLKPGEEPVVEFALGDELPVAVYAYCNLHGLWKTDEFSYTIY